MKINNDKQAALLENLVKPASAKASREQDGVLRKGSDGVLDKVELTGKRDEISRVKDKVRAEPVVNQEKVDRIKEAIQMQTYNVKGELVARGLLRSQILDEIL